MNIKIRGIEISYPKNTVDNQYFIDLFDKQGKNIRKLLQMYGGAERKIGDNNTTSTITLGISAAKKVLEKNNIDGSDIDLIMFSSQFPEYTCPMQALIIHNLINGSKEKETVVMDINVNCVGMISALDFASRYLLEKPQFKKALLIGADYISIHCSRNDEVVFPLFGDAGCAMILEKTDEDCGFIDSVSYANSRNYDIFQYPGCGSSSLYDLNINSDNKKIVSVVPPDSTEIMQAAKMSIEKVLKNNNLKISDIGCFCISQGSIVFKNKLSEMMDIPGEKIINIANKYGYTGTSSPFIAFYEGIKANKIKRGDYIVFWSIGTNWAVHTVLIKY